LGKSAHGGDVRRRDLREHAVELELREPEVQLRTPDFLSIAFAPRLSGKHEPKLELGLAKHGAGHETRKPDDRTGRTLHQNAWLLTGTLCVEVLAVEGLCCLRGQWLARDDVTHDFGIREHTLVQRSEVFGACTTQAHTRRAYDLCSHGLCG